MKSAYLLPFKAKIAGLVLLPVFAVLLVLWLKFEFSIPWLQYKTLPEGSLTRLFEDGNLTNECILGGLLLSLILIAFSREKLEDERSLAIRLQSLHISHYINYLMVLLWILGIQGLSFALSAIMIPYVFLMVFLIIYYIRLYLLPSVAVFRS
jgi:hypothetical protein